MRATSLCLLSFGLITLQTTATDPKREIGDHPNFGSVKRDHKRDEPQVHSRPVRTVKKYFQSKLYRVPRDVPVQPHEGEDVLPQLPLQLPQGYVKEQPPPASNKGALKEFQDKEESEEEVEQDADDLGKVIPATPLFVNARYQLSSRKVPHSRSILQQHPVDFRLYQQLQQNRMVLARPLNRAQLFQRIHGDNQNIDPGVESTTAVNEETCPDGEDLEAEGTQEGLTLTSYNQTGLLTKPNSIQEVHKVNLSKDHSYGVNLPNDHLYGPSLSVLPTSKRTSVSSLQQIHQMQQNPGMHDGGMSQAGLPLQPTEGWKQPPVEEVSEIHEKK